jgi:hypothetical protein
LVPVFGSVLFIILYIIAALLYPGGSETHQTSIGYSWTNNYWCNLLDDDAINGEPNTAKPVAIAGMFILGLALSVFWIVFPVHITTNKTYRLIIQVCGAIGMFSSFFLIADINHDLVVNVASGFGFIAVIGVLVCLYQTKWFWLFSYGLFNIFLIFLNNYLYHSGKMFYLPIVQKFSFLSFLVWICCIEMKLYRRIVNIYSK